MQCSFGIALRHKTPDSRIFGGFGDLAGGWKSSIRMRDEQIDGDSDQDVRMSVAIAKIGWKRNQRIRHHQP
jgi:hypothetical protein